MEKQFRCDCPITSAVDIVGDKWTIVIIKQMIIEDRNTFKKLSEGEEAIATNILSSRLKMLEQMGLLTKEKMPDNKKVNLYILTEKGLNLLPVIVELVIWSDGNLREFHSSLMQDERLDYILNNKEDFIAAMQSRYKEKYWGNKEQAAQS